MAQYIRVGNLEQTEEAKGMGMRKKSKQDSGRGMRKPEQGEVWAAGKRSVRAREEGQRTRHGFSDPGVSGFRYSLGKDYYPE